MPDKENKGVTGKVPGADEKSTDRKDSAKEEKKPFKGKGKSRNHKKNSGGQRTGGKEGKELFNDIHWHNKYADLLETVAKLPFNRLGGMAVDLTNGVASAKVIRTSVMRLLFTLSIGVCDKESDGFQAEIRKLYLAMKRKYRGLNTYETADLAYVILAITSFFLWLCKGERIYGVLNYYAIQNRDVPYTLVRALGIDYKDFNSHLADFRAGLNYLITRAQSLCLPNGISALERWFFLESNIFKDSEGARSAYYVFDIDEVFMFSGTYADTGSAAIGFDYTKNLTASDMMEVSEYLSIGEELIEALLTDDDVTLILGDVVSYFTNPSSGVIDVMGMNIVPENYTVVPGYSEEVLEQVHNCSFIGEDLCIRSAQAGWTLDSSKLPSGNTYLIANSLTLHDFCQSGGVCIHKPFICSKSSNTNFTPDVLTGYTYPGYISQNPGNEAKNVAGTRILDSWKDNPSHEDVTEMTRLITTSEYRFGIYGTNNAARIDDITSTGSEIITHIELFPSLYAKNQSKITLSQVLSGNIDPLIALTNFDWHPILYKMLFSSSSIGGRTQMYNAYASDQRYIIGGDTDNYRTISSDLLKPINDVVIMSNFKIDSVKPFEGDKANK